MIATPNPDSDIIPRVFTVSECPEVTLFGSLTKQTPTSEHNTQLLSIYWQDMQAASLR